MSTTLPLFWNLSSSSKKERIDASVKLISSLEQFQEQFAKDSSDTSEDESQEDNNVDPLDKYNAHDVSYSVRRLVRGLASPRESSRLGFSVALTELLSRILTFTCAQILSLIMDATKTQKSMTGQEERDVLFARLFGITAVIQSGLFVRTDPLPESASSSTSASSLQSFKDIVSELIALGEKKSWLRESAWWTILLASEALNSSSVPWKEEGLGYSIETTLGSDSQWTSEKVALMLKLQHLCPDHDWRKYTSPMFKNPELLSTGNYHALGQILKDIDDEESHSKSSGSSWKPELNFVWDIIFDYLLPSSGSNQQAKGTFPEFFRIVVDECLFSSTSSPERKYWGFQVFQKALPRVLADDIPMIFTKNFMRTWINHSSKPDRYLHKAAKQTAIGVSNFVKERPQLGMGLIVQLTGVNGSRQFDQLTKTKTVESILSSMNADGITHYVDHLISQFNGNEGIDKDDTEGINARRSWVMDQLVALVKNGSIPRRDDWIRQILEWFVVNGFFIVRKPAKQNSYRGTDYVLKPPLSDALRLYSRSRLLACLSDLTSQTFTITNEDGTKTLKSSAMSSDGDYWIHKVVTTIEGLEKDKNVSYLLEPDEEVQALRTKAKELDAHLRKVTSGNDAAQGCQLLLLGLVAHEYCTNEEDETAVETLESCIDFVERLFPRNKTGKKSKKKAAKVDGDDEDAPEPIDGLIDIIIGLLEKPSGYLRIIANHAFASLTDLVKESTVDLILTQLESRDLNAEDSEDATTLTCEEQSADEASEDDAEEEVDDELRSKILEALKMNGVEPVTGDTDDDEMLMDDDQMLALDGQLAEVFKSRMQVGKTSKDVDAQREATHFKNRVLDLVDLFLKKLPSSPLVINLILPLVDLIVSSGTDEKQLSDKTQGILRSRITKAKDIPTCPSRSSELLAILSSCSLYLAKVVAAQQGAEQVLDTYRESLVDFLTRKNSALNLNFFQDLIMRIPALGWSLRQDLIDLSKKAINLPKFEKSDADVVAFMTALREALHEFINDACDGKTSVNAAQMKDLFKLVLLSIKQTSRLSSSPDIDAIWASSSWEKLSDKLSASGFKSSTSIHAMCNEVVKQAKNEHTGEKEESMGNKRKRDGVDATTKRKKKKKSQS
ncbi:DNA polymerase phi-domain-containing protein [Desarmillaria tabescens]|uniref:DNA polymerase phi-domain-containing protein n=1 Tax=Armillaria tabescens TaxID=1929756 RepID=A0AA39KGL9_ARMTA|nr:DNA polymerase phi-domain-containing protein [Desarmillaria tabescens]KAK0459585.1 DNA polymerase phi-domain-containing protein [Desarmillaria tabescens]